METPRPNPNIWGSRSPRAPGLTPMRSINLKAIVIEILSIRSRWKNPTRLDLHLSSRNHASSINDHTCKTSLSRFCQHVIAQKANTELYRKQPEFQRPQTVDLRAPSTRSSPGICFHSEVKVHKSPADSTWTGCSTDTALERSRRFLSTQATE